MDGVPLSRNQLLHDIHFKKFVHDKIIPWWSKSDCPYCGRYAGDDMCFTASHYHNCSRTIMYAMALYEEKHKSNIVSRLRNQLNHVTKENHRLCIEKASAPSGEGDAPTT
jgi:hypothetical protein